MKKTVLLFSFLLPFSYAFGQYAANVKKTALAMLQAKERKDYNVYVSYFYPTELKWRGGNKAKCIEQMQKNDRDAKLIGLEPVKHSLGQVSKIYKAGKELHCLIECIVKMKGSGGQHVSRSHLLAISGNQGKTWKFIITDGKTPSEVWGMVSKFNENLTWVDTFD